MKKQIRPLSLTGFTSPEMQDYEIRHARLAREAAADGIVLLKNEGHLLPLSDHQKLALFGSGAAHTVKGGTGSGDVNVRYSVSIYEGLKNAGYEITTEKWLKEYDQRFDDARNSWKENILKITAAGTSFFEAYCSHAFFAPAGAPVTPADADTAVYVIMRTAGEGADRFEKAGDYYLSAEEERDLSDLDKLYRNIILIINSGGLIDLSFIDSLSNIKALLYVSQPGMEGGNAIADIISGKITPSGKLTDTWPLHYSDYPNAATFSYQSGDLSTEEYIEDIYVGYRYFDSFNIPVRYPFGYGLSYTAFSMDLTKILIDSSGNVSMFVSVTNTGDKYPGREVVQVYAGCPDGNLEKEAHRLVAFTKTSLLAPGESEIVELSFGPEDLASYDEEEAGWVLEPGFYGIYLGNSLKERRLVRSLYLKRRTLLTKTENLCALKSSLNTLKQNEDMRRERTQIRLSSYKKVICLPYDLSMLAARIVEYDFFTPQNDEAEKLADRLSRDQLIALAAGDPDKGQGSVLGSAGVAVPGSAGETSSCALSDCIAGISLADGPAGLRLNARYAVRDGHAMPLSSDSNMENGFFGSLPDPEKEQVRYQNCTAFPVGSCLAQSWDTSLMEQIGNAVGEEMNLFGITLWLAPGMNIHRNPLCGRNFEYYSEDPLITGKMAAAMTAGVQSVKGCGTTLKHFACNNQEDNRNHCDSRLGERALREIYLRGFGIAIRDSHPMSIMTSYNLINGIHSANNYDLCTRIARHEFGFDGVIMTDWLTTCNDPACTAAGCMIAGNDLVMPGLPSDSESIRRALEDGSLSEDQLKLCITHLIRVILRSGRYE